MSFAQTLKNRLQEVKQHVEKDLLAEESVVVIRLKTCDECPRLYRPTQQCKECGCFVKAKSRIKNSECPLGKW
jgi:predicted Zn-ribbon and HTH transcriptional regulator